MKYGLKEHFQLGLGITIMTGMFAVMYNQVILKSNPALSPITNGQVFMFLVYLGIIYWPMIVYVIWKPITIDIEVHNEK